MFPWASFADYLQHRVSAALRCHFGLISGRLESAWIPGHCHFELTLPSFQFHFDVISVSLQVTSLLNVTSEACRLHVCSAWGYLQSSPDLSPRIFVLELWLGSLCCHLRLGIVMWHLRLGSQAEPACKNLEKITRGRH